MPLNVKDKIFSVLKILTANVTKKYCSVPSWVLETIWFFVRQNLSWVSFVIMSSSICTVSSFTAVFLGMKSLLTISCSCLPFHTIIQDQTEWMPLLIKKNKKKTEWYTTLVPFCGLLTEWITVWMSFCWRNFEHILQCALSSRDFRGSILTQKCCNTLHTSVTDWSGGIACAWPLSFLR